MPGPRVPDRRLAGPTLAAPALLAVTACSDTDASPLGDPTVITLGVEATEPPITESASVATSAPAAPIDATDATAATVPVDAPAMLAQALDGVAAGFHFRTAVSVAPTLRTDSGKATFCATVRCGNSE